MNQDLTTGSITGKLWRFALPLMAGNVLQQFYNLADTLIVGRYLGADALAAVGASYSLMTFLTSVLLGLCMGSSAYISIQYGRKADGKLRTGLVLSFGLIGMITILLNGLVFWQVDGIVRILQVPAELQGMMKEYLVYIFLGITATFLYNFFANLLRAIGNSVAPLLFLAFSVILNIGLDVLFVVVWRQGIAGAAIATVISQYLSGLGLGLYYLLRLPELHVSKKDIRWDREIVGDILNLSGFTCLQQSVMNFGILMVQGLMNSFGATVMAAFAAAVKIDTIAYMPVQDYGNAFSTFVAQNFGAGKPDRIRQGIKNSVVSVFVFCAVISLTVCLLARPLMGVFIDPSETEVIAVGVGYLRIEAAFYFGIGLLFMLYGYYRAVNRPQMSVVLTVCSLGTRVLLAYLLSGIPSVGVVGIWAAIPIGWFLADLVGAGYYLKSGRIRTDG